MSVETIFATASQKPPAERAAYLDMECGTDAELRRKVERLLAAHDAAGEFLESPAARGTVDYEPIAERVGTMIGPYKLMEQIGEGGFGLVFVAEQQEPVKRKVALKIIKPGMDTRQVVARFEAERQALALMEHPNIAKVLDAGATETGRPYFVMELVRGIPITEYCDQNQLAPKERLELFISVCQAIQHAHQKGIIHRDIKPSNVLVTSHDGKPVAKVIDFGVAKAIHQHLTERTIYTNFAQMVGTPLYMSPEQAEMSGLDIDTRSDIYSLGVLLYELLTGTTPLEKKRFRDAAFDEIRRLIREEEPPKPSMRLSESKEVLPSIAARRHTEPAKLSKLVRGDLDWITMKAPEKDRTRRYETCNGLAMDVQRYLADEPVLAGPPSASYRARKFVRRNRGPALAAALLALTLIGGVIGTTLGMWKARSAERIALDALAETGRQRDRATEISHFLEDDLLELADSRQQARASMLADPELKVKTLVLRAAERISGRFADKPAVEAALRTTIGNALRAVGEAAPAIPQFERALQLNKQLFGADAVETIYSKSFLARAQMDCGKLDDAKPLCEQALAQSRATLGDQHADTLSAMNDLAFLLQMQGALGRALPLFERTLELRQATLGPNHDETLLSMNNLGYCYFGLSQFDKSLALHQGTYQRRLAKHGENHPDTLVSLDNVATTQLEMGAIPEALPLLEKSVEMHRKRVGMEHPNTWRSMDNLSWTYQALGQLDRAIPLGEETLKLRLGKLGPNHPDTFQSMNNLGSIYFGAGQFERSLELHLQALAGRREKLGDMHQHTIISMNNVATSYMALGAADRAAPILEKAVELNRLQFGADNPSTLHCMNSLAGAYLESGQVERAVKLLEQTLAARRAKLPVDHPETLRSMQDLARSYQVAGLNDKSLPLFEETLQRRRRKLGPEHKDTLVSAVGFASNQLAERKYAQAEAIMRESLPLAEKKHPVAWFTAQIRYQLGASLIGQNKFVEAEPHLIQGYQELKERSGTMPVPQRAKRRIEALESLIRLYESQDKPDEAAKWKKELEAQKPSTKP